MAEGNKFVKKAQLHPFS